MCQAFQPSAFSPFLVKDRENFLCLLCVLGSRQEYKQGLLPSFSLSSYEVWPQLNPCWMDPHGHRCMEISPFRLISLLVVCYEILRRARLLLSWKSQAKEVCTVRGTSTYDVRVLVVRAARRRKIWIGLGTRYRKQERKTKTRTRKQKTSSEEFQMSTHVVDNIVWRGNH